MQAVTEQVVRYSPDCIIVPVANPLDAMCQAVYRLSKFPRERVIGMAGVLDSARMRTFLAMELNVSVQDVSVFVLGGHGDEMVPLARYSTIGGVPLTEMLPADRIEAISKRTAGGGGELTKLIGTSAWVAPGTSAAEMVECILKDKKKIHPCSVFLQGEYGIKDLFVGVPVKLGAKGVEQIVQITLTPGRAGAAQQVGGGGEVADRRHRRLGFGSFMDSGVVRLRSLFIRRTTCAIRTTLPRSEVATALELALCAPADPIAASSAAARMPRRPRCSTTRVRIPTDSAAALPQRGDQAHARLVVVDVAGVLAVQETIDEVEVEGVRVAVGVERQHVA